MTDELDELLHAVRLADDARRAPPSTLTAAVRSGDAPAAAAFLDAGADIEERSIGFASPLQAAAGAGDLEMVGFLLARGASPRQKEDSVYSPLSAAAGHGHLDVVRRLADAMGTLDGETHAVREAVANGRADVVAFLLERGAPLEPHAGHTLRLAALRGRFFCVKLLLAAGVDPRVHPDYGRDMMGEPVDPPYLPRQAALDSGHTVVALLLDGKAVSDEKGRAAEAGLRSPGDAIRAALTALGGPPSRRRAPEEPAPLEGAAREAAVARIVELVRAGAPVNVPGRRGRPPLVTAAEGGHVEVVSALLEAGAAPDVAGADGETALLAACRFGHAGVAGRLLDAGADANRPDAERLTPLMVAAGRGAVDCVRLLLARGADPRVRVRGKSAKGFAYGVHKAAIRAALDAAGPA